MLVSRTVLEGLPSRGSTIWVARPLPRGWSWRTVRWGGSWFTAGSWATGIVVTVVVAAAVVVVLSLDLAAPRLLLHPSVAGPIRRQARRPSRHLSLCHPTTRGFRIEGGRVTQDSRRGDLEQIRLDDYYPEQRHTGGPWQLTEKKACLGACGPKPRKCTCIPTLVVTAIHRWPSLSGDFFSSSLLPPPFISFPALRPSCRRLL
ncbi:hypothetical protein F5Y14DRAFT_37362 [Nemania sp. NC0429]|nr:hypothetical protein F5Y14DRAFT_37362 [Nemania sp. NC0429]